MSGRVSSLAAATAWVTFGVVAVYRPRLFDGWWLLDYLLTALVIAWLAAFQWAALCWLMEKVAR